MGSVCPDFVTQIAQDGSRLVTRGGQDERAGTGRGPCSPLGPDRTPPLPPLDQSGIVVP